MATYLYKVIYLYEAIYLRYPFRKSMIREVIFWPGWYATYKKERKSSWLTREEIP